MHLAHRRGEERARDAAGLSRARGERAAPLDNGLARRHHDPRYVL